MWPTKMGKKKEEIPKRGWGGGGVRHLGGKKSQIIPYVFWMCKRIFFHTVLESLKGFWSLRYLLWPRSISEHSETELSSTKQNMIEQNRTKTRQNDHVQLCFADNICSNIILKTFLFRQLQQIWASHCRGGEQDLHQHRHWRGLLFQFSFSISALHVSIQQ